MKKNRKRSLRSRARSALRGSAAASGTVTLATLGLTTCNGGCGVEDPLPPPPLVCKEANHGQNLSAYGTLQDVALLVHIYSHFYAPIDTVSVSDVVGATLDSLKVGANFLEPAFTLDSLAVTEVRFRVSGRFNLAGGPCNFQRIFTVTINDGQVDVAQREGRLPLDTSRDVRIELVEREGLRVMLRAAVAGAGTPEWRATAGTLERIGRLAVTWDLPPEPGYYQIELSVDRGARGVGFDALALEVT
jgi:hypothetical protein